MAVSVKIPTQLRSATYGDAQASVDGHAGRMLPWVRASTVYSPISPLACRIFSIAERSEREIFICEVPRRPAISD